jgi:hypothetical protein
MGIIAIFTQCVIENYAIILVLLHIIFWHMVVDTPLLPNTLLLLTAGKDKTLTLADGFSQVIPAWQTSF